MSLLADYPEAQSLAMFYFARRRKWMLDEFKRVVNLLREQYAQGRFTEKVPIDMSDDDAQVKVWNEWMGGVVTLNPNAKVSRGPMPLLTLRRTVVALRPWHATAYPTATLRAPTYRV
jgi:hypothetical protein